MTREEFIGIAADAVQKHEAEARPRHSGYRGQPLDPVWTSEIVEVALRAVGAWEMRSLLAEAVEMGMPYGPSWFGQIGWTQRVEHALTGKPIPEPIQL